MKLYRFGPEVGRPITHYASDFIITPLLRLDETPGSPPEGATEPPAAWTTPGGLRIACMHIGPGGVVGYHQAVTPQLFLVVAGTGWVRGTEPEYTPIGPNMAAFWAAGEWHESGSDTGMTAIVCEGASVDPARWLPEA
jgi:hypothetical protein